MKVNHSLEKYAEERGRLARGEPLSLIGEHTAIRNNASGTLLQECIHWSFDHTRAFHEIRKGFMLNEAKEHKHTTSALWSKNMPGGVCDLGELIVKNAPLLKRYSKWRKETKGKHDWAIDVIVFEKPFKQLAWQYSQNRHKIKKEILASIDDYVRTNRKVKPQIRAYIPRRDPVFVHDRGVVEKEIVYID